MSNPARPDWPCSRVHFVSFDGSYDAQTMYLEPDRYRFWEPANEQIGISRGAGLSYVAASFVSGGTSIGHRLFNRLLDFDSQSNILEVESGVTLGQIYDFATPRGLFLAVQPGHPNITVGGCVAPDVHGKNQYCDGTMISQVESLRLFHPRQGLLELSRSRDPDLFRLTCGGFGLTGNIITVRLRLTRLRGDSVRMHIHPLSRIQDLSNALATAAEASDLVYSWHDFTLTGDSAGSGFIVTGAFDQTASRPEERLSASVRFDSTLSAASRARLPFRLFNRATTTLLNRIYPRTLMRAHRRALRLDQFLFPVYDKEFYFALFGRPGFHEMQMLLPLSAFPAFIGDVIKRLADHPVPATLVSCKLFRGSQDLVRFTGDGICIAFNFPRRGDAAPFANFLDELMLRYGGWPNLIKDSRLSKTVVAKAYPEYELFRHRLREFDAQRVYQSELSQRLDL